MFAVTNHIATCGSIAEYELRDTHKVMQRFAIKPNDVLQLCGGIPVADLWARLGYQMIDRNDLEDFADLMRYCPSPAKNLSELVLTDPGYVFWKEHGFAWIGEFLLADGSPSLRHLQHYLQMKRIAIPL